MRPPGRRAGSGFALRPNQPHYVRKDFRSYQVFGAVALLSTSALGSHFGINIQDQATLSSTSTLTVGGDTAVIDGATLISFSTLAVENDPDARTNLRSTSHLGIDSGPGTPDTTTDFIISFVFDLSTPGVAPTGDSESTLTPPAHDDSGANLIITSTGYFVLRVVESAHTQQRAISQINVTVPAIAIINGKPVVPHWWAKSTSSMTAIYGPSHIHVTADAALDPDVTPVHGSPAHTYRWGANDLPYTGDYFETWPSHGAGPDFHSLFPYRPKVRKHIHYGAGSNDYTYSKVVFFNNTYVEHMWLDLGATVKQPYTWIFAGFVLTYPNGQFGHFLLDSGKALPGSSIPYVRADHVINDGQTSRALILAKRDSIIATTRQSLKSGYMKCNHSWAPRPKVYAAVFNGANSYVAEMDTHKQNLSKGRVDVHPIRHVIMGRAQNHISDNYASHMGLFEVRYFNKALTPDQIRAQYRQLAATYRFNLY